ncbi:MAG: TlpA family protein disulfide reductase [Vogesella sp.]|uniref:TlpA family protein disulfide reductase n=1 Tax=Vogesella sp. TaxID=1904252 RepID=UPI00391DD2A1
MHKIFLLRPTLLLALLASLSLTAHAGGVLDKARLTLTSGQPATFAPFQGKYTVVNFWATWCAPCRHEMPMLSKLATQYAAKGIKTVGIALDQPEQVADFLKKTPVSYPVLMSDGDGIALMRELGNKSGGLPYTVILNAQGKPVKQFLGLLDEKTLNKTLAGL